MAIKVGLLFNSTFAYRMFHWSTPSTGYALTVFPGTQPTSQELIAGWLSGASYRSTYLAHFQTCDLAESGFDYDNPTNSGGSFVLNTTTQGAVQATAVGTGTATWGIFWPGRTDATPYSSALTTNSTISGGFFIILPVTGLDGNGVVKLGDANITTGDTVTVGDVLLTFGGGVD